MNWQPIKTAPVDRPVSVGRYWYGSSGSIYWEVSVATVYRRFLWIKHRTAEESKATHWKELPEPPK